MPNFGPCSIREFEQGLDSRLVPTDVKEDDLYFLMIALDEAARETEGLEAEAFGFPVKALTEPVVHSAGVYALQLLTLDDDFDPVQDPKGTIDTLYLDDSGLLVKTDDFIKDNDRLIVGGYLQGYRDETDHELESMLGLIVSAPVTVSELLALPTGSSR